MTTALTWGEFALLLALLVLAAGWAGAHAEAVRARTELERQRERLAAVIMGQARERAGDWR